jgi:hypothetical protein
MNTKITVNKDRSVTVARNDEASGQCGERTYFVRATSGIGYIRYHTADGGTSQICEGLRSTGSTLRATKAALPGVLRREIERLKVIEKGKVSHPSPKAG